MNINENIKKTLKQHQEIFEASYKTAAIAMRHVEQITTSTLGQAQVPTESIKMLKDALNECNKTRDTIKKKVDDNYRGLQVFFK